MRRAGARPSHVVRSKSNDARNAPCPVVEHTNTTTRSVARRSIYACVSRIENDSANDAVSPRVRGAKAHATSIERVSIATGDAVVKQSSRKREKRLAYRRADSLC